MPGPLAAKVSHVQPICPSRVKFSLQLTRVCIYRRLCPPPQPRGGRAEERQTPQPGLTTDVLDRYRSNSSMADESLTTPSAFSRRSLFSVAAAVPIAAATGAPASPEPAGFPLPSPV